MKPTVESIPAYFAAVLIHFKQDMVVQSYVCFLTRQWYNYHLFCFCRHSAEWDFNNCDDCGI